MYEPFYFVVKQLLGTSQERLYYAEHVGNDTWVVSWGDHKENETNYSSIMVKHYLKYKDWIEVGADYQIGDFFKSIYLTVAEQENIVYCILQDKSGNILHRNFIANSSVEKELESMLYIARLKNIDEVIYLGKTIKTSQRNVNYD